MPRYDLKTPCKNCPFRSDDTGIRFRCVERAEEIEESAYRNGFPCHLSAELIEDEHVHGDGGYAFGAETQHCVGFIIMQLRESCGSPWPGIDNDDDLLARLEEQVDWDAPVFHSRDEFLAANGGSVEERE